LDGTPFGGPPREVNSMGDALPGAHAFAVGMRKESLWAALGRFSQVCIGGGRAGGGR
jgi:hypothetical protein